MHGIMRIQNLKHDDPSAIEFVRRIKIRYADGRELRFKPMGEGDYFNEDDTRQLVRIIMRASSTAEWRDINTRLGF